MEIQEKELPEKLEPKINPVTKFVVQSDPGDF